MSEIEVRALTLKRVGVDVEYRGCFNNKRDVVLSSDVLIPDLKDFSGYEALIIPSGPQFRKLNGNPVVLEFVKDAHAAGLLIASFCIGPRGGGPSPGDGFERAPVKEICDAIERELGGRTGGSHQ